MTRPFIPDDFLPPTSFETPSFRLEPLSPAHNERDYEAWTSSMDHIRATPGDWGKWPQPMTLEQNMADMEMHFREFTDREAFTYSILEGEEVIGCLYIYPDKREETQAYVSSWVTESRAELDVVVRKAISDWLASEWPFDSFRYAPRDD